MYTLKKDINTVEGQKAKVGDKFVVTVKKEEPYMAICENEQVSFAMPSIMLPKVFKEFYAFTDPEVVATMHKKHTISLTGKKVKHDGWDDKGFPSVLLAAGLP